MPDTTLALDTTRTLNLTLAIRGDDVARPANWSVAPTNSSWLRLPQRTPNCYVELIYDGMGAPNGMANGAHAGARTLE